MINAYIDKNPCGDVLQDVTVKLGPTLSARVPDLSFLRTAHVARDRTTFIDGPVDIVVEVIGLDSRNRDRADKYYEYEAAAIPEYWLIDPIREQADFFVLESNGKFRSCPLVGEGYFESLVLPGLRVFPKWLWQNPLPRVPSISEEAGIK